MEREERGPPPTSQRRGQYYQQLPLQPLDPEAIRALLRDQLGEDPSVAALPEIIHARTNGNPFFIEEMGPRRAPCPLEMVNRVD